MSEPIDEYNPFTAVVILPNHGDQTCRIEWTVDQASVDLSCADFLIRRAPDQGFTNVKLISASLKAGANYGIQDGSNQRFYYFVDEAAYKGTKEATWYYQVILRQKGDAHYSGWVSAKGRNPRGRSIELIDPSVANDADCKLVDLNSTNLIIDSNHAIKDQEDGFVSKQQLGITRQIMNLEGIHHKRAGTRIAVLKRLLEGEACSDCRDIETSQVRNSYCERCYGTGIIGGYSEAVCTFATDITPRREALVPNPQGKGQEDPTVYTFRYASEPEILQYDVIVQLHDDLRFVVEKIDKFMFKGKQPLISHITMSLVNRDHIIYKIPEDCKVLDYSIATPPVVSSNDVPSLPPCNNNDSNDNDSD